MDTGLLAGNGSAAIKLFMSHTCFFVSLSLSLSRSSLYAMWVNNSTPPAPVAPVILPLIETLYLNVIRGDFSCKGLV